MARTKHVRDWTDKKTGLTFHVRLTETNTFTVEAFRRTLTDETYEGLIAQLVPVIRNNMELVWHEVIEVTVRQASRRNSRPSWINNQVSPAKHFISESGTTFQAEHFWIGRMPNGDWMQYRGEPVPEAERTATATHHSLPADFAFGKPASGTNWEKSWITVYMPYSVELWTALLRLQQAMITLEERLAGLITTPEGQHDIAKVGLQLLTLALTAGKEE